MVLMSSIYFSLSPSAQALRKKFKIKCHEFSIFFLARVSEYWYNLHQSRHWTWLKSFLEYFHQPFPYGCSYIELWYIFQRVLNSQFSLCSILPDGFWGHLSLNMIWFRHKLYRIINVIFEITFNYEPYYMNHMGTNFKKISLLTISFQIVYTRIRIHKYSFSC